MTKVLTVHQRMLASLMILTRNSDHEKKKQLKDELHNLTCDCKEAHEHRITEEQASEELKAILAEERETTTKPDPGFEEKREKLKTFVPVLENVIKAEQPFLVIIATKAGNAFEVHGAEYGISQIEKKILLDKVKMQPHRHESRTGDLIESEFAASILEQILKSVASA